MLRNQEQQHPAVYLKQLQKEKGAENLIKKSHISISMLWILLQAFLHLLTLKRNVLITVPWPGFSSWVCICLGTNTK